MKHGVPHIYGTVCPKCLAAHPESHTPKKRATYAERKEKRTGRKRNVKEA